MVCLICQIQEVFISQGVWGVWWRDHALCVAQQNFEALRCLGFPGLGYDTELYPIALYRVDYGDSRAY